MTKPRRSTILKLSFWKRSARPVTKTRPNWQSVVLALPPFLLWLRISLAFGTTMVSLYPLLLGAVLSALIGGFLTVRKPRVLPLCAVLAWLLWFALPQVEGMGNAVSFLMGAAALFGIFSVPAAAAFFSGLGRKAV